MFRNLKIIAAAVLVALAAEPASAGHSVGHDEFARGAVGDLTTQIQTEAATRAAQDAALQSNIDAEAAARAAADAAEEAARIAADAAEATARVEGDTALQGNIDAIMLTPGPTGPAGPAGPPGAAGDGTFISVLALPIGADGDHPLGTTLYDVVEVCGASEEPFEAGVLDNPNTPGRISAAVVDFQPLDPDVQFKVIRNDDSTHPGDIINAEVEFFVRCIEFSSVIVPPGRPRPSSIVFVTSARFDGALGGITGADAKCQAAAEDPFSIVPSGTYLAWISDDTGTPLTRFTRSPAPYIRPDGVVVAFDFSDLTDGSLVSPIIITEDGATFPFNLGEVWTGTFSDGSSATVDCRDWTSSSFTDLGLLGLTRPAPNSDWTDGSPIDCFFEARLYCFQQ